MTDILETKNGKVIRSNPAAGTIRIYADDSPYAVPADIHTVWADAVHGPIEIDLPSPTGSGRRVRVMKVDETSHPVRVQGKRVNGHDSIYLQAPYEWGLCHDAGDDWFVFQ